QSRLQDTAGVQLKLYTSTDSCERAYHPHLKHKQDRERERLHLQKRNARTSAHISAAPDAPRDGGVRGTVRKNALSVHVSVLESWRVRADRQERLQMRRKN
ncbi:hypothetical protein KUCAC02_030851, partial [Chaenocephalus aceratus]